MFDRWIHPKSHLYLHLVGMCLNAVGLPLNRVVLSIGTIWILANWILELDFKSKIERLKQNKLLWVVLSLYIIHLIGLFWTSDFEYALHDLRAKLPIFTIPLVCGTRRSFPKEHLKIVLISFLFSLLITAGFNLFQFYRSQEHLGYREMSLFGSHIRYGLLVLIGVVVSMFLYKKEGMKVLAIIGVLFFTFYTITSGVGSSIIVLSLLVITIVANGILSLQKTFMKAAVFLVFLLGSSVVIFQVKEVYDDVQPKQDYKAPTSWYSALGNPYNNNLEEPIYEKGYLLNSYINIHELEEYWGKIGDIKFNDSLATGYPFKFQLIRYMTSRGLTKDSVGLSKLTQGDIQNIRNGINSIVELENPFKRKLYKLHNEYSLNEISDNPNGYSFLQRIEHWNVGLSILKKNWAFGVGTGDVQMAFDKEYERQSSLLSNENRLRAHSQFLTFGISFGVIGILILFLFVFAPLKSYLKQDKLVKINFLVIICCSFIFSDMLETQVGVTLTAFFYSLLFFEMNPKEYRQIKGTPPS